MTKDVVIGLFGYGCVGQGLHDVLNGSRGLKASIKRIAVKNPNKKRNLPDHFFTYDKNELLNDDEINLIVELIDNAEDAYEIVTTALKNGKNVVSANKKMIAENFAELVELQEKNGVSLLYEASSCACIPIIRTLEEYYDNEMLSGVSGIFNGSSNYILSKVLNEGMSYEGALKQAQELGFAETDPTLDVAGYDAKYKLVIITGHAYGVFVKPHEVFNFGIENLNQKDIEYVTRKGLKIKSVATVKRVDDKSITSFVIPQFIEESHQLYNVENEYNGVTVEAAFSERQLFIGKGAGGHPTGSAVFSDISANTYNYGYEYKKYRQSINYDYTRDVDVDIYLRYENPEIKEKLKFTLIGEEGDGYLIGKVKLENLYMLRGLLVKEKVFVALVEQPSEGFQ